MVKCDQCNNSIDPDNFVVIGDKMFCAWKCAERYYKIENEEKYIKKE